MIIQVNAMTRISVDPLNFMVETKTLIEKGASKGEIRWVTRGYYSTALGALHACVKMDIVSRDEVLTIAEFGKLYKETCELYRMKLPKLWSDEELKKLIGENKDIIPEPTKKKRNPARGAS